MPEVRQYIGKEQQRRAERIFAQAENIRVSNKVTGQTGRATPKLDCYKHNWMMKYWNCFRNAELVMIADRPEFGDRAYSFKFINDSGHIEFTSKG